MGYIDTINELEEWKIELLFRGKDRIKASKIQRLIDRLRLRHRGLI